MDELIAVARGIAETAHEGQVDKSGAAYIEHPRRVAERVSGDPGAVVVAWLHDVVEDTEVTLAELAERFPPQIVAAVDAVTKRAGEAKADYYRRVAADPLALAVKRADIADNTDPVRLGALPPDTRERLRAKYAAALEQLTEFGRTVTR